MILTDSREESSKRAAGQRFTVKGFHLLPQITPQRDDQENRHDAADGESPRTTAAAGNDLDGQKKKNPFGKGSRKNPVMVDLREKDGKKYAHSQYQEINRIQ